MTDLFDRATEHEEWLREMALNAQAQKGPQAPPEQWDRLSAKWCEGSSSGSGSPMSGAGRIPAFGFV